MKTRAAVAFAANQPLIIVNWYTDRNINDAFDLMYEAKSIRSVVVF